MIDQHLIQLSARLHELRENQAPNSGKRRFLDLLLEVLQDPEAAKSRLPILFTAVPEGLSFAETSDEQIDMIFGEIAQAGRELLAH